MVELTNELQQEEDACPVKEENPTSADGATTSAIDDKQDSDSHTECATDDDDDDDDDSHGGSDEEEQQQQHPEEDVSKDTADDKEEPTFVERKDVIVQDHQGYSGAYTGRLLVVPSNNTNDNDEEMLRPDGHGSMQYHDHPEFQTYTGSWKHGAFDGQGVCHHINGDSYAGMHQEGFRHGSGTYTWTDGRTYSGSFVQGLRHGQGCYTWPGGITYSGAYDRGVRSGYGKYTDPERGIEYTGDWLDGMYHGYGILSIREEEGNNNNNDSNSNSNRRVYRGHFQHGRAHGQGVEFNPDGSVWHDGLWEHDAIVREKANDNKTNTNKNKSKKPITNTLMVVQNEQVCDANGLKGNYRGILHMESRLPHGNGVLKYHHPTSKKEDECLEEYEGCFDMGRYHGKGRLRWKNQDTYDGDYVDGKKHGKGVYKWSDGRQYKGDFFEDKRHGFGTFVYGKHSSDVYVGEFREGRRHGHGRFVFQDGSVYEGAWEAGKYNGEGKLISSDKRTYVGTFKDGLAHGQGKEIGTDGEVVYEGLWIHGDTEPLAKQKAELAQKRKDAESATRRAPPEPPCEAVVDMEVQDADGNLGNYTGLVLVENKKPHGVGRMVYLDGRRIHEGWWRNGLKEGHGRCLFVSQQDFHEGNYKNNVRHGHGQYKWKDGRNYVGNYENDLRHGKGVFTYPNGDRFEGIFDRGEKRYGRFSFKDGYYEGYWMNNKYEGRGKLVSDNEVFDGIFEDGSFIKTVEEGDNAGEVMRYVDPEDEEKQAGDNAGEDMRSVDLGAEENQATAVEHDDNGEIGDTATATSEPKVRTSQESSLGANGSASGHVLH